jgi:hypothetical protein
LHPFLAQPTCINRNKVIYWWELLEVLIIIKPDAKATNTWIK